MDDTTFSRPSDETATLPVSQRVVRAVADETDTDPADLEPLYHTVDPDCLDALFRGPSRSGVHSEGRIAFTMAGCEVVVRADGTVSVESDAETVRTPSPGSSADHSTRVPESPD